MSGARTRRLLRDYSVTVKKGGKKRKKREGRRKERKKKERKGEGREELSTPFNLPCCINA